jgi:integrase/recombinase XerD
MPGKHYRYPHMIRLEIQAFLLDRQAKECLPNTLIFYQNELKTFQRLCEAHGIAEMEKLTPTVIRACIVDLQSHRNKGGISAFGKAIRAFLNWFEEEDELPDWKNPIHKIKKIGEQNRQAIPGITPEEIQKLINVCGKKRMGIRNRAILFFLFDTGIRVTEMCNLKIKDVNLQTGQVNILSGKGGFSGVVFISTKCKRELLKYLRHRLKTQPGDPLFQSNLGNHLTRRGVDTMLASLCQRAGIPKRSAHDFRRAFTKAALLKTDVVTTARLLRHKDTSLVMRYAHQDTEDLHKAHQLLSPADTLK